MTGYNILSSGDAENDYPLFFPETNLDLINSRSIPPEYTFTRNSSGTYVGADGLIKTAAIGEPRFEFDPVTGEFKGLLIEEARTNYQITDIPNNIAQSSIESTTELAPNGTNTAIKLLVNSTAGEAVQWDGSSDALTGPVITGEYFSISYWLKGTDGDQWIFSPKRSVMGGGSLWAFPITHTITSEWTRYFQVIQIPFEGSSRMSLRIIGPAPSNSIYIWGMQVERGNFSTSYIPTSGSTVTRQPDQLVLNRTLNPQGAFYIESNNTLGTSLVADNGSSVLVPPQGTKSALFYNTSRTLSMSSSTTPVEGNYNIPQNLNRVSLGFDRLNNTGYINGHLKKFMYYGSPVTEDNLRSLTGNTRSTFRFDIGEPIVIDGLVLLLDAGNPASYPGSGITWSDLSGNGNNGTLVNGVGYNSANGGSLVFDGVDDYVLTPVNIDANPNTVSAWFNASSTSGARGIVLTDNGGWDKGFEITNGVFNIHVGNNLSSTGVSALSNTWYFGTIIYTSISMSFYINGTNVWNGGAPGGTSGSTVEIGRANFPGGAGSRFFIGNIAQVSIYNRALSSAEVAQNFNAIRSRYGI
jgi:hypothetical protein